MFSHLDITGTDGTRIIATWMGGFWRVRVITPTDNTLHENVTNEQLATMTYKVLPHHFIHALGATCCIDV